MQDMEMSEQQMRSMDESSYKPHSQKLNAGYGANGSSSSSLVGTESSTSTLSSTTSASTSSSSSSSSSSPFPDEVLEHVLAFITSHRDRNAISLVCKAWYKADQWSRANVFIGNCYSCSPQLLTRRFPNVKSLTLKGKPRFSDFNLVPANWGANVSPWLYELAAMGITPCLEELRLKRMTVNDESLEFIARSFPNFSSLVLIFCDGFSTDGLAAIAANCRNLTQLDIQECTIDDRGSEWLSAFPETFTSLTSLNLTNFSSEVSFADLERIVARCESLEKLKLSRGITLDQLRRLLLLAGHRLKELGIGSLVQDVDGKGTNQIATLFESCTSIRALSGLWEVVPHYLPLMYPLCGKLRNLNLSDSPISRPDFVRLISQCHTLECLWVQDLVEDRGLEAVAMACKKLRELRVVPSDTSRSLVTERGMVAISRGCRASLRYILFFCNQMTNAAMHEFAANCPEMTHFRLCIMKRWEPDYATRQPMDEGFGAIVRACSRLRRLSVSGLLTDRAFELIGQHAKQLRSLSLAFVGDSGLSMDHLLRGCGKLKKLEIRDCPFGDAGLLSGLGRYYEMRSLWMSSCDVSLAACQALASQMPLLNVEVIIEDDDGDEVEVEGMASPHLFHPPPPPPPPLLPEDAPHPKRSFPRNNKVNIEKLYVYRSVSGPRTDHPPCVYTL